MIELPGLTIERQLGEGGTAFVAKAYFDEFKKDVAVKYPINSDQSTINEFHRLAKREFQLIGHIKFPGFIRVLKLSEHPPYLLLELCNGITLDKIKRIDNPTELLSVISAIAADMEYLRLLKIVHGDLKPHNIFLPKNFSSTRAGQLFFVKISDFGLGRQFDEPESVRAGHGTIGYAAPETMSESKATHQSDLFSLGVIAYQLATGEHPFIKNETDPVKIESRVREEEPSPIGNYRSDLPPAFIESLNQLLAKDKSERPQSAWEVCEKLRAADCRYAYEKVLSSAFVFENFDNYDNIVNDFLELDDALTERLHSLTGARLDCLRLVLTANFRRDNLRYVSSRFRFRSNVYWPSYLRRQSLKFFTAARWRMKKQIVNAAVVDSNSDAVEIGLAGKTETSEWFPGIVEQIHPLLNNSFLRRFSFKYAQQSEEKEKFNLATKLFVQAGKLEDAGRCAQLATMKLSDARQRREGTQLINRVIELAQLTGREFDVRQILMVKGDIQRTSGLVDQALDTYQYLIKLYSDKPPDKLLAETYRDMGDLYKTKQNFTEGIAVLKKAMEIYRRENDELAISRTLKEIGNIYWIDSNLPESLKHYRQALSIQKRLGAVADAATALNNIGSIYGMKGRVGRTITILNIALKMKRKVGDEGEIARSLNNLGYAHQLSGQMPEAVNCLQESLEINRRIGSKKEVLSNLWNLSQVMIKSGNLRKTINYLKEGLELSAFLNVKPHQAHFNESMGEVLRRLCRFSEASDYYQNAGKIVKEIDDKLLEARLLNGRSELRYQIGDDHHAVKFAESALELANKLKAKPEALDALLILIKTTGEKKYLESARNLAAELKFTREKILVEFYYLQFLLENSIDSDLKSIIERCEAALGELENYIELPHLLNIAAEVNVSFKRVVTAQSQLTRAQDLAHADGLLIEEITSDILLGKIEYEAANYEISFTNYKRALQLCRKVTAEIKNENDRNIFMNKPKVKFLAQEIIRLSKKMGAKDKAGV